MYELKSVRTESTGIKSSDLELMKRIKANMEELSKERLEDISYQIVDECDLQVE